MRPKPAQRRFRRSRRRRPSRRRRRNFVSVSTQAGAVPFGERRFAFWSECRSSIGWSGDLIIEEVRPAFNAYALYEKYVGFEIHWNCDLAAHGVNLDHTSLGKAEQNSRWVGALKPN